MKLCPKKTFEYIGLNSVHTFSHYITEKDILSFHGETFFNQWKEFLERKNIKRSKFGTDEGYYYFDYKEVSYTTKQFLDSQ